MGSLLDYFSFGKNQYYFLKEITSFTEFTPIREILKKSNALLISHSIPRLIKGLMCKNIILIEGHPYYHNYKTLSESKVKQIIQENKRVKINSDILSFLNILEIWFEKIGR